MTDFIRILDVIDPFRPGKYGCSSDSVWLFVAAGILVAAAAVVAAVIFIRQRKKSAPAEKNAEKPAENEEKAE